MKVFRLAKEKVGKYRADDLSGQGVALVGGRWNPKGMPALHTCANASTCVLEMRVHANGLLPVANLFLVTFEIPDEWIMGAYTPPLPADWNALDTTPASTVAIGKAWLDAGSTLVMRVPSVVCPADFNLILNPLHAAMTEVKMVQKAEFKMDRRLFN